MKYKNWDDGEPSSNGKCGYIRAEHNYKWDDEPCSNKKAFLCKIMKRKFLQTELKNNYVI